MRKKNIVIIAALAATIVASILIQSMVFAQTPWVNRSYCLFEVWNNTGTDASEFHMIINGIHQSELFNDGFYDSNYTSRTVTGSDNDDGSVEIVWKGSSTAAGASSAFGFTLGRALSPSACDMYWAKSDGTVLGHVSNVFQSWISSTASANQVKGEINNLSGSEKYIQRIAGYSTDDTDMNALTSISTPPNAVSIDPSRTAIEANSSKTFDFTPYMYAPYSWEKSLYLFYEVYSNYNATNPEIRFRNAVSMTPMSGSISFTKTSDPGDTIWYPENGYDYIPMLILQLRADPYENAAISSININSWSNTEILNGITSVDLWIDNDNNGKLDQSVDRNIGTCVFASGSNEATINLSPTMTIPAGNSVNIIVTIKLNSSAAAGDNYGINISDAYATGEKSGMRLPVICPDADSSDLIVGAPSVSIAEAKKLPINEQTGTTDTVTLEGKIATADFQTTSGLAYIEEQNRSCGIGVLVPEDNDNKPIPAGTKVTLIGNLKLLDNSELVFDPQDGSFDSGTPLNPIALTNKNAGGGAFGSQPAVYNTDSTQASGLNNIGMLVKTWGKVVGVGSIEIDGNSCDAAWIDDGSGLSDGFTLMDDTTPSSGIAVLKPSDWDGIPSGYIAVTGILRAIPNGSDHPVRLLVPRSKSDIVSF